MNGVICLSISSYACAPVPWPVWWPAAGVLPVCQCFHCTVETSLHSQTDLCRHHANLLYHSSFSIYSANKSMISLEDKPEHSFFWRKKLGDNGNVKLLTHCYLSLYKAMCFYVLVFFSARNFQWLPALKENLHNPLSASWEKYLHQLGPLVVMSSLHLRTLFSASAETLLLCFPSLLRFVLHSRNFFPKKLLNCSWKSRVFSSFLKCPLSAATLLSAVSWKEHNVY